MVLRSDQELLAAWRALAGGSTATAAGWRTIPVAAGGPCRLLAGRRFPNNEESLVVGFRTVRLPAAEVLPHGRGFLVVRAELDQDNDSVIWIALCRQSSGNLDLFAMMADDIVATLSGLRELAEEHLFRAFLARIAAWQDFMRRGGDGVLGPEEELGLFGELEVLVALIAAGVPPAHAVDAWQGPLDGVQDFPLGTGAIEVKTTVHAVGVFPAKVGSLEQLDDGVTQPMYLAGVRLVLRHEGRSLPDEVATVRQLLVAEPAVLNVFDRRLLHGGFLDATAERYTRRFSLVSIRVLPIGPAFPRLTRSDVSLGIRRAQYEVDLDRVATADVPLTDALLKLGVI
jgi:hypothetical protein